MKQALMISCFNNEAGASCCLRKQETSPMIHVFFYYCITVGMASIKIVSFRKLYQIQSQVIQGSLKSRGLDKTRVIYDLISLEAICLHKRSISVEKLLNVISNRSVNHRVCRYRHRNKTYLPIKRRGSYWPTISLKC